MILHSTRSGQNYNTTQEHNATVNYVKSGADGLGWTATIGDGVICYHMSLDEWGWNARAASSKWLAVELAQAKLDGPILDSQIEAAAAVWIEARSIWPSLPLKFINHSDLPEGIADGKSDVCRRGDSTITGKVESLLRKAGYR